MNDASMALKVIVALFVALESANVVALYFAPGSQKFNAIGVFKGWEASKQDPHLHTFVRYLVNWVAGAKLIFIGLWLVLLFVATPRTQLVASAVMIPAIATFYWRLFPLVRQLERDGQMTAPGYSRVLGWMIATFIALFAVGLGLAAVPG